PEEKEQFIEQFWYRDTSGFFVSNRKIQASEPSILDIAPTLYRIFEVEIPSEVDGKPLTIF
ncbi:hypothetical protein MYX04_15385, partial [Nitrospiraceae bacterium AH_259_D15_M11_P09]|nr:hypothetical protein [Nitrospiraceae bacterium AH_259_D15_M11_P09]